MTNSSTDRDLFSQIPEQVLYSDISDGAYRVYGALARIVDTDTRQGFVLVKTLAERLGRSESSVKRNLKELSNAELIESMHQWTDGNGEYSTTQHPGWRQTANLYVLPKNLSMGSKSEPPAKSEPRGGVQK